MQDLIKTLKQHPYTVLFITAAVLVAMVFVASNWFFEPETSQTQLTPGPPPAHVTVSRAVSMTMAPSTVLPGTIVSVRDAVIAAETSGKVLSVALVGTDVVAEQSLAEIDAKDAQQLVVQRKAELERLRSELKFHSDYYNRVTKTGSDFAVPEIVIAERKSNMDTAKAEVTKAQAELRLAENDLARTSIRAPFAGSVVSQSIQPGEYAQVGSPIVRLVDTINLEMSAQVPASMVQAVSPGTELKISGMGKEIFAPLRALVPVGDVVSRTMELRVALLDSGFLVGSPVRVSLPSAEPREVVAIPRDAVILRTGTQYAFVIDEDGNASRRDIQLGYAQGDMIEVIGNVAPGDAVVTRGGERLRDGQRVSMNGSDGITKQAETENG